MPSVDRALADLEAAHRAVFTSLRSLEGAERHEGIRKALKVIGASELARGLGISRARVYQLRNAHPTRSQDRP